jgi:hypothetical protein
MAMHLFYGGAMRGKKARTNDEIFAAIAKDNGRLDIYSVPEFDLVFSAERAANGPRLINNVLLRPPPQSAAAQQSADTTSATSARIAEIALHSIGNIPSLPHLFVRAYRTLFPDSCRNLKYARCGGSDLPGQWRAVAVSGFPHLLVARRRGRARGGVQAMRLRPAPAKLAGRPRRGTLARSRCSA